MPETWGPGVRDESSSLAGNLAWKHNDAEDADAAEFAAGGDMTTVSPRGDWATAKLLVNQPAGGGDGG